MDRGDGLQHMIECRHNLAEYFRDRLQRAAARLQVGLTETSEFYLVNLLDEYRTTEKCFVREGKALDDLPLAMLLERAVHSGTQAEKIRLFKRLGDTSLFMAGFFPDRMKRRLVDLDYYVSMGGGAYLSLASLFGSGDTFNEIFAELGDKFATCVELLTEMRRLTEEGSNRNLLEVYERWMETGSAQLEQLLRQAGIPTATRTAAKPQ